MDLLSFDALQALTKVQTKRITVQELGGDIFIKRPQAKDQIKFDEVFGLFGTKSVNDFGHVILQTNPLRLAACKVAQCVVDPSKDNQPIFTEESVYCLSNEQIYAIAKQIDEFSQHKTSTQDDVAKN